MANRIVVDPITRIEGHLRIEADLEGNTIKKAYSAGTMVRGIELILKGRDPREAWAFAQRICGVCTSVHALSSIRAVEDALEISVPKNASLIRKLMEGTIMVHDHVVHFYQLHLLDWINPITALEANPQETAKLALTHSKAPKNSVEYFNGVLEKLKKLTASKQLGIFTNGYWDHPDYKLTPEENLLLLAHYLEALVWQSKLVQIHTLFGGKNPHPNYLVGGVPAPINLNGNAPINMDSLEKVNTIIDDAIVFVEEYYLPDLKLIAKNYPKWFEIGENLGNFLVLGEPLYDSHRDNKWFIPPTFIQNRDLNNPQNIDYKQIKEYITHSWYDYSVGDDKGLHPFEGETNLHYTGPKPPFEHLNTNEKYSWVKAPRYKDYSVETGPLARVVALYARDLHGIKAEVDTLFSELNMPIEKIYSTMGRTLARGLDAKLYAHSMKKWFNELMQNIKSGDTKTANQEKWQPSTWPKDTKGYGIMEAPRGSLSHWVHIKDEKIENYQAVVPTTWNASPRDAKGQPSAYESSLLNHTLAKLKEPLEILRTIHSFDPCMACAVHVYDKKSNKTFKVKIQ